MDVYDISFEELENQNKYLLAGKVCNALDDRFMKSINKLADDHEMIDFAIINAAITSLLSETKELKTFENKNKLVIFILENIGIEIVENKNIHDKDFEILYSDKNSKMQVGVSSKNSLDYKMLSVIFADIFTSFTNGRNTKLYSKYQKIASLANTKTIPQPEAFPKIYNYMQNYLSIIDDMVVLSTPQIDAKIEDINKKAEEEREEYTALDGAVA